MPRMASVRVRRRPWGQRMSPGRSASQPSTVHVTTRVAQSGRILRKKTATPVTIRFSQRT